MSCLMVAVCFRFQGYFRVSMKHNLRIPYFLRTPYYFFRHTLVVGIRSKPGTLSMQHATKAQAHGQQRVLFA